MSGPTIEIVDGTSLPRPGYDVHCEPGLVSDYYQVQRGYHIIRRKGSATSYLVYSLAGCGFFRDAKDRVIRVGRGDLVLVEPHTYQEYGIWPLSKHWKCHWVHFDVQPHWFHWVPLAQRTGVKGVTTTRIVSRAAQNQVNDLFFQLHSERKLNEVWRNAIALHLLERILILARRSVDQAPARSVDPRVSRVLQAIETSSPDPPTAAELMRLAGLSRSRLASLFRQNTGISILTAVNRVRLRAAQHALQEQGISISEAAERAGFQSPFSFSNWYLKQTGLRPRDYRRRWIEMMQQSSG
jgi:AraC family transcriptional regulator, arabinose operon regulatory protein